MINHKLEEKEMKSKKTKAAPKRGVVSAPGCSAVLMAKLIASDVFDCGVYGAERPNRILFKLGKYNVSERDGCGLCEKALADVIAYSIRKRFMPNAAAHTRAAQENANE